MAARYPIAGSVYQWSKQVAGKTIAWFAGWIMMIASIVTVAAVAIAWQIILPQISMHFQFVGDGTGSHDFAENAVILGLVLITFTTTINILGVRLMARINNVGVAAELIGASVLIVLLAIHTTRGPQVVTETFDKGPGLPGYGTLGYLAAFLIGAIMPAYVMFGFDTAGSLAEETNDPRRKAPRAILMALGAAGVAGMLLLLFALMSAKDLHNENLSSNGLPYLVKSVLGSTLGDILLWDVVLSVGVCCLAIQTAAIRMMFSMARDNALPGSTYLAKVSERSRTPIVPALLVGGHRDADPARQHQPAEDLHGHHRHRDRDDLPGLPVRDGAAPAAPPGGLEGHGAAEGLFSMGGAGLLVNVLAVAYGGLMAINIGWPRNEIYGAGNYMWGGIIFIVGVIALGGIWFAAVGKRRIGVLDAHSSAGDEIESQLAREQAFGGP